MNKKSLEVFGLSENFTRSELEKQYELHLRRAKQNPDFDIKTINDAYDDILGITKNDISEEELEKREKRAKRATNTPFIVIGGVILVVFALIFLPSLFKESYDLNVSFVGGFYFIDDNYLAINDLLDTIEEVDDISIEKILVDSTQSGGSEDLAARLDLAGKVQAHEFDIIIASKEGFEFFLTDTLSLVELTDVRLESMGINKDTATLFTDSYGRVYGVDVSDIDIINDAIGGYDLKILCVGSASENYYRAVEGIKLILND